MRPGADRSARRLAGRQERVLRGGATLISQANRKLFFHSHQLRKRPCGRWGCPTWRQSVDQADAARARTADSHESMGASHAGHDATVAGATWPRRPEGEQLREDEDGGGGERREHEARLQARLALALSSTPRKTAHTPATW